MRRLSLTELSMSYDDNGTLYVVKHNNQAIFDALDFFVTKIYFTEAIALIFSSFNTLQISISKMTVKTRLQS
jgi:ATP/maltotriose-dependent transcriptional regulator MalT